MLFLDVPGSRKRLNKNLPIGKVPIWLAKLFLIKNDKQTSLDKTFKKNQGYTRLQNRYICLKWILP